MDKQEARVLLSLKINGYSNQRIMAQDCGYSIGTVNRALRGLMDEGMVNSDYKLTTKAEGIIAKGRPVNAIILAAGFGMRMVPINHECPKGLLEVNGEPLIERIIKQLNEVGVTDISVIVGFMKEQYEYLIDRFGVRLVVNREYASKNNLHSLRLAADKLGNTYVIPCDIRCKSNPFGKYELNSWYMVSELQDDDSMVRINRKEELVRVSEGCKGNAMIGVSYISEATAAVLKERLISFDSLGSHDKDFWEDTLYDGDRFIVDGRVVGAYEAVEINTYEQLRETDSNSNQLKSDAISIIAETFKVGYEEIRNITVLKKGMTNRSFLFECRGRKYIMRIPGEGTSRLINRREEAQVYSVISGKGICDDIIYINSDNGYKITEFWENSRVCDADNEEDLKLCMNKLRWFHEQKFVVGHEFDLFGKIDFYETLWEGNPSMYRDSKETKEHVLSLKRYTDSLTRERCLTHIDAVPDNFMFVDMNGAPVLRLIDWEYSGMQDPHLDIAMFCIYSLYERPQIDRLIDIYFEGNCPEKTRVKIYCYIAAAGLLWSNWCEYKSRLGVEFGEYSLRQYRYAKDYYKIAQEEMGKCIR